jgi:hypothetical protein
MQRAHAEFSVRGDGDMVLPSFEDGGQANVASGLAGNLVAVRSEQGRKLLPVQVVREFQAGITSSFTR